MTAEFIEDRRLIDALSFEQNDIYDAMIREIDRLAAIEVSDAVARSTTGELRVHTCGRAQALQDLVEHFEKIREQIKEHRRAK